VQISEFTFTRKHCRGAERRRWIGYSASRHFRPITRSARTSDALLLKAGSPGCFTLLASTFYLIIPLRVPSRCFASGIFYQCIIYNTIQPSAPSNAELQDFSVAALLYPCSTSRCISLVAVQQAFHNAAQPSQSCTCPPIRVHPRRARRSSLTLSCASPHLRSHFTALNRGAAIFFTRSTRASD